MQIVMLRSKIVFTTWDGLCRSFYDGGSSAVGKSLMTLPLHAIWREGYYKFVLCVTNISVNVK